MSFQHHASFVTTRGIALSFCTCKVFPGTNLNSVLQVKPNILYIGCAYWTYLQRRKIKKPIPKATNNHRSNQISRNNWCHPVSLELFSYNVDQKPDMDRSHRVNKTGSNRLVQNCGNQKQSISAYQQDQIREYFLPLEL